MTEKLKWWQGERTCETCKEKYTIKTTTQKYCCKDCRDKDYLVEKPKKEKKKCRNCQAVFKTSLKQQKYCSKKCREKATRKIPTEVICHYCRTPFKACRKTHKFCTDNCAQQHRKKCLTEKQKETKRKYNRDYYRKHYRKIRHNQEKDKQTKPVGKQILNEKDFIEWFEENYVLFGISKVLKANDMFPDIIAKMYDGKILRIELEFSAQNFINHQHDPNSCDLIISYIRSFKTDTVCGVPVISIFKARGLRTGCTKYDPETLELTNYFKDLIEFCGQQTEMFLRKHPMFDRRKQEVYQTSVGQALAAATLHI